MWALRRPSCSLRCVRSPVMVPSMTRWGRQTRIPACKFFYLKRSRRQSKFLMQWMKVGLSFCSVKMYRWCTFQTAAPWWSRPPSCALYECCFQSGSTSMELDGGRGDGAVWRAATPTWDVVDLMDIFNLVFCSSFLCHYTKCFSLFIPIFINQPWWCYFYITQPVTFSLRTLLSKLTHASWVI